MSGFNKVIWRAIFTVIGAFAIFFSMITYCYAEDFTVERYRFEWTVAHEGEARLDVVKTDETTYIIVSGHTYLSPIRLTAEEAVEISKAMAKTGEYYTKQKGAPEDRSEIVVAGAHRITFNTSPQHGFSVIIAKIKGYSDPMSLDKFEAMKFQPYLAKANELVKFINEKIIF